MRNFLNKNWGKILTFTFLWYFNKNHKHHHSAMSVVSFWIGIFFLLIGFIGWDISKIISIICYGFSVISFATSFNHVIKTIRKKEKNRKIN